MATQDTSTQSGANRAHPDSATPDYGRPLAIVTTLFFMCGFLTSLNDILVPHLKSIFDLSFFSAYFLFSIPWVEGGDVIGYPSSSSPAE
jgi:FHS family L-fucose permease-like MFS transporter